MTHRKIYHHLLALLLVLTFCFPNTSMVQAQTRYGTPPKKREQRPNGISVSRPKIFDNRTLTIMLESLSEALRGVQTQFINQQSLAAAFNNLQGSQSQEVVRNLSINPVPIPGTKQENITTTGNVTATGTPLPDTTKTTTTSERATFSPQAPALENPPAFSGFNPTFGENPSDLLSDQVNLTYQIFNLRMLLERSLSDRLLSGESGKARRQAVLGFNVTIDPPKTAENAVAVTEITLQLPNSNPSTDGLSLVSLMPQEKTYNAAALTTKSNSFGGSAVVKLIQVGYSERHRGQVFYLYRDNDTVSYERMSENSNEVTFGWMFRPVLGRRSVSPGLRQLFAIVSLPNNDLMGDTTLQTLDARVRTYWKKYDRQTMTSFSEDESDRSDRLKYALTFNLSKPEIFDSSYINTATYAGVEVKSTDTYQAGLRPVVSGVTWVPVGPKSALISVTGDNFFSGTQITMGDKLYSSISDGLIIKSNQAIDIATNLDALAAGPGALIGRYGSAIPLVSTARDTSPGIEVGSVRLGPSLSGNRSLEIDLLPLNGSSLRLSDLPVDPRGGRISPIVSVNGTVAPLPYALKENPNSLTLQTLIPDSMVAAGGAVVKVSWPFYADKWTATGRLYDPTGTYRALRLDAKRFLLLTSDPLGFRSVSRDPCWKLLIGDKTVSLQSSTCKKETPGITPRSDFGMDILLADDAPDKVVLVSPEGFPYQIDIPKAKTEEPPAPKLVELKQFDSIWIDVPVKDVAKVASVEANQLQLKFRKGKPDKDGAAPKNISVQLTRELTSKPGDIDLTVWDKEGNSLGGVRLHITACENCGSNGGK
ncbi:MAG TPA: hypothetical protein VHS05_06305 [Pyrinomonadaceae bacterium]|nr:hypothetical protein [Pyrinomonadaceae bacterium]